MMEISKTYDQNGADQAKSNSIFQRTFHHIKLFIDQFLNQSGIHGLVYFVKGSLTWMEKLFWIILVIVSLYCCVILGLESLDRFYKKCTVVSIEKDHYYWNTSLPSMTLCPINRLSTNKFDKYCEEKGITGTNKEEFWNFMESLANSTYENFQNIKSYPSIDKMQIDPQNYMALIYNLTDDLTVVEVDGARVQTSNNKFFIHTMQVLTEFGICYVANSYLSDDLSAKLLIFGEKPEPNPYEQQVNLLFQVRMGNLFDGDLSYDFVGFNCGVFVFLHSPHETMQIDRILAFTDDALETEVNSLEIITADNFERSTTIDQRNCRYQHESNLTHFKVYSKLICLQECRLRLAYEHCKCIPHFYPNRIQKPKKVCSYKVLKNCFVRHQDLFLKLYHPAKEGSSVQVPVHCNCQQNCKESKVIIEAIQEMPGSKVLMGGVGGIMIVKKYPVIRFRRQIIFTFTDLLVSIGGTAGFFLGFSVLGAAEIIYYFTIRLFWYWRGYR